jgi:hypothetical protein
MSCQLLREYLINFIGILIIRKPALDSPNLFTFDLID